MRPQTTADTILATSETFMCDSQFQLCASNKSLYTAKKPWESSPNPSKQETPWSEEPFWALNSKYSTLTQNSPNFGLHFGQHHVISCSRSVRDEIGLLKCLLLPLLHKKRTVTMSMSHGTADPMLSDRHWNTCRDWFSSWKGPSRKRNKASKADKTNKAKRARTWMSNDEQQQVVKRTSWRSWSTVQQVPRRAHHRPSGSALGGRHTRLSPARVSELQL